tara:strand:- start:9484 stop:9906 length:423 start_codon:yes stop_codon:yes gene_type:complete
MIKYLLLTLIGFSLIFSQTSNPEEPKVGQWRWSSESLEWTHDKEAHFAASFGLYYFFKYKGEQSTFRAINSVFCLGLVKEGVDALLPWEEYGSWGGDGWSNADLMANAMGVGTAWLIDKYWHPKIDMNLNISFYYDRNVR